MTIVSALPFTLQNGTTADATQVMADFDSIVDDVNANAAHNGVNADITALTGITTPLTPTQGGSSVYHAAGSGNSSGTANAQLVVTAIPDGFALTFGNRILFAAAFSNTGPMTLNVNSTGVTPVFKRIPDTGGEVALTGGEVQAGQLVECIYAGGVYTLNQNVLENGGYGPFTNIAGGPTVDLGIAPNHSVQITGGPATINAFGSSASTTYPFYKIIFSGVNLLVHNGSTLILPGSSNIATAAFDTADVFYNGAGAWIVLAYYPHSGQPLVFSASYLQNYLAGLVLSAAGATGTFGVAAGEATDSTNARVMLLASAYTKTTASWVVGSGNGGLDTGAIANATWYHVFLITRIDTGVVDVLFSLSPTSPTLPANYTLFRRIGAMKSDGAAHWLAFTQTGATFIWATPVTDVNTAGTAARVSTTLSVPTGVVVTALFRAGQNIGGGASAAIIFTSLQEADQVPVFGTICDMANVQNTYTGGSFERVTNTSAQIGVRSANTVAAVTVSTFGWKDLRGQ